MDSKNETKESRENLSLWRKSLKAIKEERKFCDKWLQRLPPDDKKRDLFQKHLLSLEKEEATAREMIKMWDTLSLEEKKKPDRFVFRNEPYTGEPPKKAVQFKTGNKTLRK